MNHGDSVAAITVPSYVHYHVCHALYWGHVSLEVGKFVIVEIKGCCYVYEGESCQGTVWQQVV